MPTESRITPPDLQPDMSMVNHLFVAPGAAPGVATHSAPESSASHAMSHDGNAGLEAEETIWEGRYSLRNFLGRAIAGCVLIVAWIALAIATWGFGWSDLAWVSYGSGMVVLVYWLVIGFKLLRIRRTHHYRLTTRRLFLTTGVFHRRVDQVELIRIKDLFIRQSLVNSWLDVGTLILISSEETLPKAHLLGVEQPQRLRDLIWHHSRLERDQRASEVHPV